MQMRDKIIWGANVLVLASLPVISNIGSYFGAKNDVMCQRSTLAEKKFEVNKEMDKRSFPGQVFYVFTNGIATELGAIAGNRELTEEKRLRKGSSLDRY